MSKAPDLSTLAIPRKGEAAPAAEIAPTERAQPRAAPPSGGETRTTVSTRLTIPLQKRLRRCAFETEKEKQTIIEEALDAYLQRQGF